MTGPSATAADPALVAEAVALAREAAAVALRAFHNREGVLVAHKADGSLVTATDRAVEHFLRDRIQGRYPDDAMLGEEFGARTGTSGRRWIIDPIDGTEAFVRGVGEFCTLVAVEDEHGPLLGVIAVPALEETIWAGRGRGAHADWGAVEVSRTASIPGACLATSDLEEWPSNVLAAAREAGLLLRTWGGGYGMELTVSGRVDAFVDFGVDEWDLAPAPILAAEAGGHFSALDGSARLDTGAGLLSNGRLHEELLSILGGDRS